MPPLLKIHEVAQRTGLPASTVRYYEEKRLIQSAGRHGLSRLFHPSVLERLSLISLGQSAGFSLDEIASMFSPDGHPRINRQSLAAKAAQLDATIRRLTRLRDGLRHAAACPAPNHLQCPKFRRLMQLASAGASRTRTSVPRQRRHAPSA